MDRVLGVKRDVFERDLLGGEDQPAETHPTADSKLAEIKDLEEGLDDEMGDPLCKDLPVTRRIGGNLSDMRSNRQQPGA